jgi:hypothetical protein
MPTDALNSVVRVSPEFIIIHTVRAYFAVWIIAKQKLSSMPKMEERRANEG